MSFLADAEGWHGKSLDAEQAERAIAELGGVRDIRITPPAPAAFKPVQLGELPRHRRPATPRASPRARPSARRSPGSPGTAPTSWCWTARSATPRTPRTSRRWRRSASSRCTSRSRRWWAPRWGCRRWARRRSAPTFGAFYTRALGLRPHGGDQPRGPAALRLARRCLDRRGRPLADGARGPRGDARRARLHRAVSGRRQRDREARRRAMCDLEGISYLRTTREKTPALYGRRRGVPDRRLEDAAQLRRRTAPRSSAPASRCRGARGRRGPSRRRACTSA